MERSRLENRPCWVDMEAAVPACSIRGSLGALCLSCSEAAFPVGLGLRERKPSLVYSSKGLSARDAAVGSGLSLPSEGSAEIYLGLCHLRLCLSPSAAAEQIFCFDITEL